MFLKARGWGTQMVTAFVLEDCRWEAGYMHVHTCLSGSLFPLVNLRRLCHRSSALKPSCTVDHLPNAPSSITQLPTFLILYRGRKFQCKFLGKTISLHSSSNTFYCKDVGCIHSWFKSFFPCQVIYVSNL